MNRRAVAVLVLLATVGVALVGSYRHGVATGEGRVQARWDTERIDRLRETGRAIDAARSEEQRRTAEVQKVADEAHESLERARADIAAAADAGQRLRQRIATITTAARCPASGGAAAAGPGPAAEPTADLLADVQRRLDQAADDIAEFATRAHTAGLACQRAYDALTP